MLQKYFIRRSDKSGDFTIEERAVIEPMPRGITESQITENNYSLIYKKTYSGNKIEKAVKKGRYNLIDAIRNPYFFPVEEHCDAIGDSIIRILKSGEPTVEIFFNSCQPSEEGNTA